jgi:hypothetical protein
VRIECVPQSADRKPNLLSVHLEPGPLSEARELGTLGNLENGHHRLELFRRRAIYVEPEEAICRKAVRELALST